MDSLQLLLTEGNWGEYRDWGGLLDAMGLREQLEIAVGEAPEIQREYVARKSGRRRWAPITERILNQIVPTFLGVRVGIDPTESAMTPLSSWRGAGIYIICRRTERYDYPRVQSCIAYIGRSIEPSGQVIKRAIDHFFAPESGYTLTAFGTKKTAAFFAEEVGRKHALFIVQNMRTKAAPMLLESLLLSSFRRRYGTLPRYNSTR